MKFEQNVIVKNDGRRYRTEIKAGRHTVITDEPLDHNGQDEGPTAHQLLLGSLGACIAITLRMYAERKGWDLKEVSVELNMEKYVEDGREKTRIYKNVHLSGELTEEQRTRLMIICEKCPVHKTLSNPVMIEMFQNG
jgi:putative redox protein